MSHAIYSLILFFLLLAAPLPCATAGSKLDIVSDKLDMDDINHVAIFSGNVLATDQEMKLQAERMTVHYFGENQPNHKGIRDVKAEGNVIIRVGDREGRGDTAFYKVTDNTLELTSNKGKASIQRGDDRLEGKRILIYLTRDRKIEKVSVQGGPGRVSARIAPPEPGPRGKQDKTDGKE